MQALPPPHSHQWKRYHWSLVQVLVLVLVLVQAQAQVLLPLQVLKQSWMQVPVPALTPQLQSGSMLLVSSMPCAQKRLVGHHQQHPNQHSLPSPSQSGCCERM
jgi:hypothetical protein